ncbi:hypothetical protein TREMEDRAFT_12890, partial [Tremella mesenterica DSM 1558]|uniref:uncharacterized protein n=1 Tax=Tremella mesenterica (strain ATCC 24925 / CBS 8224 / DSM 1558 / NBRC 9311 / NRRL Y-6157 / RJB 2259-6 / UBC 559-6) TaxID=578456 RepID=UPI0003F49C4F
PRPSDPSKIVEIKLYSTAPDDTTRFNLMKFNYAREFDPLTLPDPLLTRKQPGERIKPTIALDDNGNVIGKYVYDNNGKLLLGADGRPIIEHIETMDVNLVGQAKGVQEGSGSRRKFRNTAREVFHQDVETVKLKREEAQPWVLEAKTPREKPPIPEHWVGRMVEGSTLPMVLFVNEGKNDGFSVVPLGRTYRFNPERPFKVLDSDEANKLFEFQAKNKFVDRWSQRPDGASSVAQIKPEPGMDNRAARIEQRVLQKHGESSTSRVKVERYEDDYLREGRAVQLGVEGGIDEELDFDANEHFQDDDDVNDFHRNDEEEEEAKLQEEKLKKEFRMANANVGDKPQIDSGSDSDDLFGDKEQKLTQEGKRVRKMMRKRGEKGDEELWRSSSSSESDSESDSVKTEKKETDDKDTDKEKGLETSAAEKEVRSRANSRGPNNGRPTASPSRRSHTPAVTSQPGSGAALVAQRATGQDTPHRSRGNSPISRSRTPTDARSASPTPRGVSPSLSGAVSPSKTRPTQKSRDSSSKSQSPNLESASAQGSSSALQPGTGTSNKRKTSPTPPFPSDNRLNKKKKRLSATPTPGPEVEPFEGMITPQEVVAWFKEVGKSHTGVAMNDLVLGFKKRILASGDKKDEQQKMFLSSVRSVTEQGDGKMMRLRPEY